jgi:hypothetical protein
VSGPGSRTTPLTPKRKSWLCPKCGTRNERVKQRCANTECRARRPKRRVPAHARTLRDDSYEVYRQVNAELHAHSFDGGWTPDHCGVCGTPPKAKRHDRDHDHRTGLPRGLACWHCNRELLRNGTLESLRAAVRYLEECQ